MARTRYRVGNATFLRECFISEPDQVLVMKIQAEPSRQLNFSIDLTSPHPHTVEAEGERQVVIKGQWVGDGKDRSLMAGVAGQGLRFEGGLSAELEGGHLSVTNGRMAVRQATSVTLRFAAATSFKSYQDITGDPAAKWRRQLRRRRQKVF